MKRNMVYKAVVGATLLFPITQAHAEEKSDVATIRLSHGILRHDTVSSKSEAGPVTNKEDSSGLTTFPAGIEIAAFFKGYSVYAYPLNQGTSLWVGKAFGSNMELGATASLNTHNVKDGDESSSHSIGAYFYYTAPISSAVNFEFDANPALIMGSGKTISGTTTTKTESSGYSLYLDAFAIIPLMKNLDYAAGLDYNYLKRDDKSKASGVSATTNVSGSGLGIILAKFRYYI